MEGNYKDDYPVDTFYYYDSKGNVTIKNYFTNQGKNTHTWLLFPNGKVQAEGNYIEKGRKIKVIQVDGTHIIVREINA